MRYSSDLIGDFLRDHEVLRSMRRLTNHPTPQHALVPNSQNLQLASRPPSNSYINSAALFLFELGIPLQIQPSFALQPSESQHEDHT